jgi:hypothetical protein
MPFRRRPKPRALLETSAASGSPTALVALGRAHQLGQLGPDAGSAPRAGDHMSAPWLQEAAVAEVNLIGLMASGALGDPDWPALRRGLRRWRRTDVPGAAVTLAEMLATGRGGRAGPRPRARLAADAGAIHAMRLLGWMQIQGVGGAWTAGGPRVLLAGRQAGQRRGGDGSGSAAPRRAAGRPDRPRAAGSNGARGPATGGAPPISRGF